MTSTPDVATPAPPWFARDPDHVAEVLTTSIEQGLTDAEASDRLAKHGPNSIASEPAPSVWQVALAQFVDPMNIMLAAVAIISMFINQASVGVLVGVLVVVNVVLGTRQELKARASVDALAKMQIPQAKVIRGGTLQQVDATSLVPGDVITLEAGDVVPADGRIVRSATLETQEAALTGESLPIAKDPSTLDDPDTALGDRTDMVFQNTEVTRGTASVIVTETGMGTQMGRIAAMLSAVKPQKSPLQRELAQLTRVLSWIAWGAVAAMVVVGLVRGEPLASVILLGISMAISAIPTGMPTFVQAMLSFGARKLADQNAIVKNLNDVETLGATSAINSDKTGTLTMNQMTVESLYFAGDWYTVSGSGYSKSGQIRGVADAPAPDFTPLALGLTLCSDATVSDDGDIIGDPTEAALVVLAAKIGADAELTRAQHLRAAEVPFDSAYKFMATFHEAQRDGRTRLIELVKGGPDVVLDRCSSVLTSEGPVPIEQRRQAVLDANRSLSEQGLRVLSFAFRWLPADAPVPDDPMAEVTGLTLVALVGIIDPLRPSSAEAVRVASEAGIEVRMITGDHAITAAAIGAKLGLGDGAASGAEIRAMSDEELTERLPHLHVFGRVTPEDKLRLARLMQAQGAIVAMTGDAVNDAAALKQADIGVAMGSGSDVTKQAGKMILVDDNFGTLVTAIRLGRSIYDKINAYIRFQMSQLISLVLLFLVASAFNINHGVPLTPIMVLFLNFFIVMFPVILILNDPTPPGIMARPPRDPSKGIANPSAVWLWLMQGGLIFITALVPLLLYPGQLSTSQPNVPVTMTFVIVALGSTFSGLVLRRDPDSGLAAPILSALGWLAIPLFLTVAAVEAGFLQRLIGTASLTRGEWLMCLGLSLVVPVVIECEKWLRRRRLAADTATRAVG